MFWFKSPADKGGLVALLPGEDGLTVAELQAVGERPQLQVCEFSPWDGAEANEKLLAKKVRQYGLHKRPCTTVLELGDYSILSVEAPDVPPAELRAAIRWQIKDLIDFHIDDAVIDVFDAPPSGAHGRQNNLYVVVSKTSTVRARVDQLQAAEANLTTIDIPELVLRNIAARLPEDEGGLAMIYLTRERGVVIVTRQSTLYFARTLDMGYDYLRQGLDSGGGLSLEGNAGFDRLVLEVQRSLDYYDRYFAQPPVAGLVLAPTEQPIPGLDDYLGQSLGLPVRQLDLGEIVACDTPLDSHQQAHCLAAVGAALRQEPKTL
jgi:MSHA biogenesis protein MshI